MHLKKKEKDALCVGGNKGELVLEIEGNKGDLVLETPFDYQ